MNREQIREMTMQVIFQMDVAGDFNYENLSIIDENLKVVEKQQAIKTFEAIRDHISDIDALIEENTNGWTIDRIAKTELAIMRNAVAEIAYNDEIPAVVSINEAVKLAKKYGSDKSYAFVNSVLGRILKNTQ